MKFKIASILMGVLLTLGLIATIAPKSALADSRTIRGNLQYDNGMRHRFHQHNRYTYNMNYNVNRPRHIVLIDRDNRNSYLSIYNRFTGPHSYNYTRIYVNHDSFLDIVNNYNTTHDIDISVDTGNNTISYNTFVGMVQTGDVNIDVSF